MLLNTKAATTKASVNLIKSTPFQSYQFWFPSPSPENIAILEETYGHNRIRLNPSKNDTCHKCVSNSNAPGTKDSPIAESGDGWQIRHDYAIGRLDHRADKIPVHDADLSDRVGSRGLQLLRSSQNAIYTADLEARFAVRANESAMLHSCPIAGQKSRLISSQLLGSSSAERQSCRLRRTPVGNGFDVARMSKVDTNKGPQPTRSASTSRACKFEPCYVVHQIAMAVGGQGTTTQEP